MTFLYLKAIHIIFIVAWFAGLFYMPRLLIYITEAHQKEEPEKSILTTQLVLMATRLWSIITWPAAIITLIMGAALIIHQPAWLTKGFMHIKLFLVALLYGYHLSLHVLFKQLRKGVSRYSSTQLRLWNEIATLLLVSIVFVIVLKNALSIAWSLAGLLAFMLLIGLAVKLYKGIRNKNHK